MLSAKDAAWVEDALSKAKDKIGRTARKLQSAIPFRATGGVYDDKSAGDLRDVSWWTNGFYPGLLWLMYQQTRDAFYKDTAWEVEKKLDQALYGFDELHHDVGFMWLLSSVASYRLTGREESRKRGLLAASLLASRYNINGGFIRAWNGDHTGWAIIDCMMNIPLLYWASAMTRDDRFAAIARAHADKTERHFIRPDGSVVHIMSFDPDTGEAIESFGGQGYEVGSSWTRGQAWALYGFALSYIHTRKPAYLDAAKRVAHYYITSLGDAAIPPCDFRAPGEPVIYDSTSGAIAACGLLEIAANTGEFERELYTRAALKILKGLTDSCVDYTDSCQELLKNATCAYHDTESHHKGLIYGDYYYLEALMKLQGNAVLLW